MNVRRSVGSFVVMSILVAATFLVPSARVAQAQAPEQSIVIDVAQPQIKIDIGFRGAELLVFGLVAAGTDAIVVIRGETKTETVRRKERFLGVWTTGQSRTFITVPSFYALAASRPIDHLFPDNTALQRYELTPQSLNFTPLDIVPGDPTTDIFRDALIATKVKQGLYGDRHYNIKFLSDQLFRTTIYIPANVPVGRYSARLYMVKDDRVIAQRETFFIVDKAGVEEKVYRFAHDHSVLYGLFAVVLALLSGWLVTLFFQKTP